MGEVDIREWRSAAGSSGAWGATRYRRAGDFLSSAIAPGRRVEKVRHLRLGVRYGACDIAALH